MSTVLKDPRLFPSILIVLDICAAVTYAARVGDLRKTIYWAAAAVLTAAVTY